MTEDGYNIMYFWSSVTVLDTYILVFRCDNLEKSTPAIRQGPSETRRHQFIGFDWLPARNVSYTSRSKACTRETRSRRTCTTSSTSLTKPTMLPKAVPRALTRSRQFHSSSVVKRIVSTNPVKAQEANVGLTIFMEFIRIQFI